MAEIRGHQAELEKILPTLPPEVQAEFYRIRDLNEEFARLAVRQNEIRSEIKKAADPALANYCFETLIDYFPDGSVVSTIYIGKN